MKCKEQTLTFYPDVHKEKTMTEVFPETRLEFEASGDAAVAGAPAAFTIEDGESYIVEFDDVAHEIVATSGAISNDLFSISVTGGEMAVSIAQAGSHTVRVIACTTRVCQLPEEYIPGGAGGASLDELKANGQIGYTETQEVEAIPEQTIEVAMNEDVGAPIAIIAPAYDFTGVSKVRVLFDGVEYICDTIEGVFGNVALVGEGDDTGEPFFYGPADPDDPISMGFFIASEGAHTVSVTAISDVNHPVNAKYLPVIKLTTAVPGTNGTVVTLSEAEHAELYAAAKAGVPVAIHLHFADRPVAPETHVFALFNSHVDLFSYASDRSVAVSVSSGWIDMIFISCRIDVSPYDATLRYERYESAVLIKS